MSVLESEEKVVLFRAGVVEEGIRDVAPLVHPAELETKPKKLLHTIKSPSTGSPNSQNVMTGLLVSTAALEQSGNRRRLIKNNSSLL